MCKRMDVAWCGLPEVAGHVYGIGTDGVQLGRVGEDPSDEQHKLHQCERNPCAPCEHQKATMQCFFKPGVLSFTRFALAACCSLMQIHPLLLCSLLGRRPAPRYAQECRSLSYLTIQAV